MHFPLFLLDSLQIDQLDDVVGFLGDFREAAEPIMISLGNSRDNEFDVVPGCEGGPSGGLVVLFVGEEFISKHR